MTKQRIIKGSVVQSDNDFDLNSRSLTDGQSGVFQVLNPTYEQMKPLAIEKILAYEDTKDDQSCESVTTGMAL